MAAFIDISGNKYGRLTAVRRVGNSKDNHAIWLFACDCGKKRAVRSADVKCGKTQSCGCLQHESTMAALKIMHTANFKHGMSHERIYKIWECMKARCGRASVPSFKNYGGRGIHVCDEWINDPKAFVDWALSHGCSPELTIDRKDNNKGYSPDNCRWATYTEQAKNKCNNVFVTINGTTKILADWSKEYKIPWDTLDDRIKRGMSPEDAVNTPLRKRVCK
jgi:hypothetical protein